MYASWNFNILVIPVRVMHTLISVLGLCFYSERLSEDGTPLPKYFGV
jgi:hypothetical protein